MSNFTDNQLEELQRLDVLRDMRKERESSFSRGEDEEMATVAKNLDFNARQRAELTHRFRRRLLPLLGYLVLAIATAFSFQQERAHSNANRAALAQSTAQVLKDNCVKGNSLRFVIRNILNSETPQIMAAVKTGQISTQQAAEALDRLQGQIATVTISDCNTIAKPVTNAHAPKS